MYILDKFYKSETNCTCAVPCERVVYEPKLSYAQLSHLNVERLVAGSNDQLSAGSDNRHDQLTVELIIFLLLELSLVGVVKSLLLATFKRYIITNRHGESK